MPPVAAAIIWLLLSHHKLPLNYERADGYDGQLSGNFAEVIGKISPDWGYDNTANGKQRVSFPQGFLQASSIWRKNIRRWSEKLSNEAELIAGLLESGQGRIMLLYIRTAVILADYNISSQSKDKNWQDDDYQQNQVSISIHKLSKLVVRSHKRREIIKSVKRIDWKNVE